jgi:hypothetical protein
MSSKVILIIEGPMPIGNLHLEVSRRLAELGLDGLTPVWFEHRDGQMCAVIDHPV